MVFGDRDGTIQIIAIDQHQQIFKDLPWPLFHPPDFIPIASYDDQIGLFSEPFPLRESLDEGRDIFSRIRPGQCQHPWPFRNGEKAGYLGIDIRTKSAPSGGIKTFQIDPRGDNDHPLRMKIIIKCVLLLNLLFGTRHH